LSFQELGLNNALLRAVDACGFDTPTEIQAKAIPVALTGRDLMASAQTGTGKTAAFVLPTLERLLTPSDKHGRGPRALILTPTRELATQITDVIRDMSRFSRLKYGVVVGGVAYPPQQRLLRAPLDILVATPGRLMDHMDRGLVNFSRLEVLILDEADRMLDMGFVDAVEEIAAATPEDRQTMLFSATLEGQVLKVAQRALKDPEKIQLAHAKKSHDNITQWVHEASGLGHKKALLAHLLSDPEMNQAVVFAATKRQAQELSEELEDEGHSCAPLHGDMTQAARRRTVDRMRNNRVKVLIATDVASRGLDVPGISHVINFDLPMVPEDYIHRIGRTGRAGRTGVAISLIGRKDWRMLGSVERLTGKALERRRIEGLAPRQRNDKFAPRPRNDKFQGQRENARQDDRRPSRRSEDGRGSFRSDRAPRSEDGRGGFRSDRAPSSEDSRGGFRSDRAPSNENSRGGFRSDRAPSNENSRGGWEPRGGNKRGPAGQRSGGRGNGSSRYAGSPK
jgi:superfamily II DNA/RNA helicase